MKHYIIGTAGHVDHGKTVLVKALTGRDTDRLKEEKERGISIELGFAPLQLPSGNVASIIDVPGHERFIKNMLAGVGGIDLVLFVIAADEGIMPQTREHMDIIQLLQIEHGIVVVTKKDLVDEDWLQLVHEEIREFVKGTTLSKAPVVDVSAATGEGVEDLRELIDRKLSEVKPREFVGKTRMPIDRVFTITGFGTVVTGTLLAGQISLGDPVEILPEGLESKVRSLQVHNQKVEKAVAGQRVAINLTGIEVNEIKRGSVLAAPQTLQASYRLDAELVLLPGAGKNLVNRARIRFHIGTKEALGRVVFLDREEMRPGEKALVQFEMEEPVVSGKNDRFVIRSYSPLQTVGGGVIIDPSPKKHKRFQENVLAALRTRQKGTPVELLLQYLNDKAKIMVPVNELEKDMDITPEAIREALAELVEKSLVKMVGDDKNNFIIPLEIYNNSTEALREVLAKYHREFPLRAGYPKEELRSRLFAGVPSKIYNLLLQVLEADGIAGTTEKYVSSCKFKPVPNEQQKKLLAQLTDIYQKAAFQPPTWKDAVRTLKVPEEEANEYLTYLLENRHLVKIDDDIYIHREVLDNGIKKVKDYLQQKGEAALGEIRDILDTSRKYALPLLEYMDREKITRRVDDKRVLY